MIQTQKKGKLHVSGSTESVDFGTSDQPRELKIGSSLSLNERSRLIDLLRSYLDVFAWSYEDMSGLRSEEHTSELQSHSDEISLLHILWSHKSLIISEKPIHEGQHRMSCSAVD